MSLVDEYSEQQDSSAQVKKKHSIIPLARPILLNALAGKTIDLDVVSPRFYNSFNYSVLAKNHTGGNFTVGLTSANEGEGKTLVAANLAVSLAIANAKETVLVDFNLRKPRVHTTFGTVLNPGVTEALNDPAIYISLTQIKHLYVLAAGVEPIPFLRQSLSDIPSTMAGRNGHGALALGDIARFRDIVYSLKKEFDFVVIDMPSILDLSVPLLLASQMDGLLIVVDAKKTTQEELESALQRVNRSSLLGFVLNRVS